MTSNQEQYEKLITRNLAEFAKSVGYPDAYARGDTLYIGENDDDVYRFYDLHELPDEISLEAYSIRETIDRGLAFSGEFAWLSNFYKTDIFLWGITFTSGEQALQYRAACQDDNETAANLVIAEDNPYILKTKVARSWKKSEECKELMGDWMRIMHKVKFRKPDLQEKLLKTKGKNLYEATRDLKYGCGWPLEKAAQINSDNTPGENLCGKALMELREAIIKDGPDTALAVDEAEFELLYRTF